MERKKASDFDPQLLGLFHKYIHGAIDRREFLEGAAKFAVGGMTALGLWEMLRPNYAWAQQVPKDDKRIRTEYAFYASPKGNALSLKVFGSTNRKCCAPFSCSAPGGKAICSSLASMRRLL